MAHHEGNYITIFFPVASDATFYSKAEQWMKRNEAYPWDTSVLKVVDNFVIGSKK